MTARLPVLIGTGLTAGAVVLAVSVVAERRDGSSPDADVLMRGQPDWRSPLPSGRMPAPPHDASGHTWHHPDDVLFRIVKEGTAAIVGGGYESDMPGFGGVLSDEEMHAVLAYIKSTWPERERSYQENVSRAN